MADSVFTYCPICATVLTEQPLAHVRRPVCPNCHFIFFRNPELVAIVVLHDENRLLLGKRTIEPGKGLWSFFGGYVERGEKVEEAAIREVKEETSLSIQLEGFIGLYSEKGDSHVLAVYEASVDADQINRQNATSEEVSELAFFTWEELPSLAFPIDQHILHDWKKLRANKGDRQETVRDPSLRSG